MTQRFILQGKGNAIFLSYLKTLSMHLEPGIETTNSCSEASTLLIKPATLLWLFDPYEPFKP